MCNKQITPRENLMRPILCGLLMLVTITTTLADESSVARIAAKYRAIRPHDEELAMYRLDWAESLSIAQERARSENRPVCLAVIHARYGDLISGHC
jgi:hypothetical protein